MFIRFFHRHGGATAENRQRPGNHHGKKFVCGDETKVEVKAVFI